VAERKFPRYVAVLVVLALVALGCGADVQELPEPTVPAGQEAPSQVGTTGQGASPLPAVTAFTIETVDNAAMLTWDIAPEATFYDLEIGGRPVRVPASICDQQCSLALRSTAAAGSSQIALAAGNSGGQSATVTASLPRLQIAELPPQAPDEFLVVRPGGLIERFSLDPNLEQAEAIEAILAEARSSGPISGAGLNHTFVNTATVNTAALALQDEGELLESGQILGSWYAAALDFDELPGANPGDGMVVAVIDSGVDAAHPSLVGRVLDGTSVVNPGETGTATPKFHGTAVSSLIVGDPSAPVPGVAPGAMILPIDVGDESQFDEADIAQGIYWAVDNGADVISISLGSTCARLGLIGLKYNCPSALEPALDYANAADVVVVASAGNNGNGADWCPGPTNVDLYPAVYDTVISVGGSDRNGDQWSCSSDRPDVDVLAPSQFVLVAEPNGNYGISSGTSFSAPLVAGLIAVLRSGDPSLNTNDIAEAIRQATNDRGVIDVVLLLEITGLRPPIDALFDEPAGRWTSLVAELYFSESHPISELLETYQGRQFGRPQFSFSRNASGVQVGTVVGSMLVRPDGTVEGRGFVQRIAPGLGGSLTSGQGADQISISREIAGFSVVCPYAYERELAPAIAFLFEVPVHITGEVVDDQSGATSFDLDVSLGVEASATEAGQLPDLVITHDNLDQCGGAINDFFVTRKGNDGTRDPEYDELGEVLAERDAYVDDVARLHQHLIDSSPFTIEARYGTSVRSAPADSANLSVLTSVGTPS